jgi:hypothetical protein
MDGDVSASSSTQRAKFNIDLEQLGVFLADAFINRVDAFMPEDRITILKACRQRLAAEGGDITEHLLTQQNLPKPMPPETLADRIAAQIVHNPSIL